MSKVLLIGGNARSMIANRGDLVSAIQSNGHDVHIVVPDSGLPGQLASLHTAYSVVPFRRTSLSPIADLAFILRMARLMNQLSPDVVLAYNAKPMAFGLLAARFARVPKRFAIVTGQGIAKRNTRGAATTSAIQTRLYAAAFRDSSCIFFQNPEDQCDFIRRGILTPDQDATVVAGSGINLDRFSHVRPTKSGPVRFLFPARLIAEKGVEEFLAAAETLAAEGLDVICEIVGHHDPSLPTALDLGTLRRKTTGTNVAWHGGVHDIRPAIWRSDVVVLPSYYGEGVPKVLLEALSTGRAIVTTDMPGCKRTVSEGINGFLVGPRDVTGLTAAMRKFVESPRLIQEFGEQSRRLAESKFDVRLVNEVMLRRMELQNA